LIAGGLLVAVFSVTLRIGADKASRNVLVLVDWRELNQLLDSGSKAPRQDRSGSLAALVDLNLTPISDRSSHQIAWDLLEQIPGALVAYGEETVGDLVQQGILSPADISVTGPTFEVSDFDYAADIERGARRHGYLVERRQGKLLVQLPPPGSDGASGMPLAWRTDVINTIRSRGLEVVLRPSGTEFFSANGLQETLGFAQNQPLMLFQGTQVPGFPHDVKGVAAQLKKQRQLFGWVEFDDQAGGAQLAALTAPYVARVHSITPEEMEKYTVSRAVERYELALTERGIRVLFLRPFIRPGLNKATGGYREQVRNVNEKYFAAVVGMIEAQGFEVGRPQPFINTPAWLSIMRKPLVTLATAAAAVLLLGFLVPTLRSRWATVLLATGALLALAATLSAGAYKLALLATGIVFPLLGFWLALTLYRSKLGEGTAALPRLAWALVALALASLTSAIGGLLIHGGMWNARALLHIEQYRGVTIALAIPVLIVAAYCWQADSLQSAWDNGTRELDGFWARFTALWSNPIRYGDIAIILLVVGAIGIVLLRSGNEGPVGVFGAEGSLREWLENALAVRPRTKELLGHPALVLFLISLLWRSRLTLLFALGGILGQVSVLNTFEHLHTPLLITLQRVGVGLLIGAVTGAVLAGLALLVERFFLRPEKRVVSLEARAAE
jgi:hypothetical protein